MASLLLLLQRAPLLSKLLAPSPQSLDSLTRIVRWATLSAATLGAHHSVSGASEVEYSTNIDPDIEIERGASLLFAFATNSPDLTTESWSIQGDLPPGMAVYDQNNTPAIDDIINTPFGQIRGIAQTPGRYFVFLQPYDNPNLGGDGAIPLTVTINVTGTLTLNTTSLAIERLDKTFVAKWPIEFGHQYALQSSTDGTNWQTLPNSISESNGEQSALIDTEDIGRPMLLRVRVTRENAN